MKRLLVLICAALFAVAAMTSCDDNTKGRTYIPIENEPEKAEPLLQGMWREVSNKAAEDKFYCEFLEGMYAEYSYDPQKGFTPIPPAARYKLEPSKIILIESNRTMDYMFYKNVNIQVRFTPGEKMMEMERVVVN